MSFSLENISNNAYLASGNQFLESWNRFISPTSLDEAKSHKLHAENQYNQSNEDLTPKEKQQLSEVWKKSIREINRKISYNEVVASWGTSLKVRVVATNFFYSIASLDSLLAVSGTLIKSFSEELFEDYPLGTSIGIFVLLAMKAVHWYRSSNQNGCPFDSSANEIKENLSQEQKERFNNVCAFIERTLIKENIPREKWPALTLENNYRYYYFYNTLHLDKYTLFNGSLGNNEVSLAHEMGHFFQRNVIITKVALKILKIFSPIYFEPLGVLVTCLALHIIDIMHNWYREIDADLYSAKICGKDKVVSVWNQRTIRKEQPHYKEIFEENKEKYLQITDFWGASHPCDSFRAWFVERYGPQQDLSQAVTV